MEPRGLRANVVSKTKVIISSVDSVLSRSGQIQYARRVLVVVHPFHCVWSPTGCTKDAVVWWTV